jgi:3-hydroxyacyl-CoA dehydrogenase
MDKPIYIKKIAVLGAGVMGAQIAAHCVNAGIETLLFDLAADKGGRNALVDKSIAQLKKLKPTPLASSRTIENLVACNYEDDIHQLSRCDLIIEAIGERMDWKESLYQKIAPHLHANAILVSNTSGLSINALAAVLPENQQPRFCGVHFFNPPRYMHLVELIPSKKTAPELLDFLESWLTSFLGKGVVRAKDTPNFIANRIGVFSLLVTLHHAQTFGLGFDEVDALTGTLIGRPKSATFRTMDVVGLDTLQHVVHTMQTALKEDPWQSLFILPDWLNQMIKQGHLGQKSGLGIYRKQGKLIEVFDAKLAAYRPADKGVSDEVKAIMKLANPTERVQQLMASKHPQAQFLTACFRDLFHYSAFHLQHIAHTVRDVDLAMRWGFGWTAGPFELWQAFGLTVMQEAIKANGATSIHAALPEWLHALPAFYQQGEAFSPVARTFEGISQLPVYRRQYYPEAAIQSSKSAPVILYENEGICLSRLEENIAMVQFKTKSNTIGQSVLEGLQHAMDYVERAQLGLILYQNDAQNFSSGADLRQVMGLIQNKEFKAVEKMVEAIQNVALRLKYIPVPTVAALRGRALGGGCELMLQCDATVAAFESYPGLVEVGVGLIPAGAGTRTFAKRAAMKAQGGDLMPYIQRYFEQIATATVASSAVDAMSRGFLKRTDNWVMHAEEVLFAAVSRVQSLFAMNYVPPIPTRFPVAGIEGKARLQVGLVNWLEGGFMSQYDYFLSNQLAHVLCGGDVNAGQLVDDAWMLQLEKEAFMTLVTKPETQARIQYILETGKPLRN